MVKTTLGGKARPRQVIQGPQGYYCSYAFDGRSGCERLPWDQARGLPIQINVLGHLFWGQICVL